MKTVIKRIQVEGKKVWQWHILKGRKVEYGGMCSTRKDAENDAAIVLRDALTKRPNDKGER
jgi:hypothetical protein